MKPEDSKALITKPDQYMSAKKADLDEMIDNCKLPAGTEEVITSKAVKKLVFDKTLGLFKVGEIISAILNWNDDVEKDIREAKKNYLISEYFHKTENNDRAVSQLKSFVTNAQGNTLFNKIIRIMDDSPPDFLLIEHLSAAMRHIVDSDFQSLFEEHKYALSLIDQLSPQGLAILADDNSWPVLKMGRMASTGTRITSDWHNEFTMAYSVRKNIVGDAMRQRISHSINELITGRFMEAHRTDSGAAECVSTEIGSTLQKYIKS
ncbi:hypothetical protein [Sphingobium sp. HWE2-09]|uniref:hypothetical protein n=1 Tax=Sphingobium sp. HWE2-09 TaxID=3108390 RepID=UPI002DCAE8B1|nr:hypothetical protein [Sphingobium sp. HWE2-09]